jgi:hypothetical protein
MHPACLQVNIGVATMTGPNENLCPPRCGNGSGFASAPFAPNGFGAAVEGDTGTHRRSSMLMAMTSLASSRSAYSSLAMA